MQAVTNSYYEWTFKTEIYQYYPVRGHSFMPCNRTFGIIKRAVCRHVHRYCPDQYKKLICSAKKQQPGFLVTNVQNEDIFNFKD